MNIFIFKNDQQSGPFSLDQIHAMLESDEILITDLGWVDGMTDWKPISEIIPLKPPPPKLTNTEIAAYKTGRQSSKPLVEIQQKASPVAVFFAVLLAIIVGGGILLFVIRSDTSKTVTGYETETLFVADSDFSSESKFKEMTAAGWEIKNSRRAWAKHPDRYDEKQWGTEYTLQKAQYGSHSARNAQQAEARSPKKLAQAIAIAAGGARAAGYSNIWTSKERAIEEIRIGIPVRQGNVSLGTFVVDNLTDKDVEEAAKHLILKDNNLEYAP